MNVFSCIALAWISNLLHSYEWNQCLRLEFCQGRLREAFGWSSNHRRYNSNTIGPWHSEMDTLNIDMNSAERLEEKWSTPPIVGWQLETTKWGSQRRESGTRTTGEKLKTVFLFGAPIPQWMPPLSDRQKEVESYNLHQCWEEQHHRVYCVPY